MLLFLRNIVLGVGQGFQPVAGYNYGAKIYKRTKDAFYYVTKVGTVVCTLSAVLIAVFAKQIIWWFCPDSQVLEYGVKTIYFACAVMPFMAFSTYVNQLFQCLGYKFKATVLASCRQGICFLPAVFILPMFIGVTGVEMAQPLADLLTFFISIPYAIPFLTKELKSE